MIDSSRHQDVRLVDGPHHVLDQDEGPLTAFDAVRFTTTLVFSRAQLDDLTVPPMLEPLVSRIEAEGGEGG